MTRSCRLCTDRPGTYRTVTVGGGLSRRWAICDHCVDTLQGARWVEVDGADDPQRVVIRVGPGTLADAFERDEW